MDEARLTLPARFARHTAVATSGTTGGPRKWALLSPEAIDASAEAVNLHLGATSIDRWLLALPTDHVGGLGVLARARLLGNRVSRLPRWSARECHALLVQDRISLTALVPTQLHDLVVHGLSAPATLRAVIIGGASLEPSLSARARGLGWPILPSFGMTETASQIATARPGAGGDDRLYLLSHVIVGLDADGVLAVRGPCLLDAYARLAQDGNTVIEDPKCDGWFLTRDRVALEGPRLRPIGRVDDVVKVGGHAVDLARLNALLEKRYGARGKLPAACFIAPPDDRLGRTLVLAYETDDAATVRAVLDELSPELAPHECPRLELPVGRLPRTALGKIDRGALNLQRSP